MTGKMPWDDLPAEAAPEKMPWDDLPSTPVSRDTKVPPSKPFLDRLYDGAVHLRSTFQQLKSDADKAFVGGMKEGFGDEPVGLAPGGEVEKWLREHGVISDPEKGKGGPLRLLNESIIRPAAALGDAVMRGMNAGIVGVGSMFGKNVEQVTGDETAGAQAKREAINLMNWAAIEGGGVLTSLRYTPHGLKEIQIGGAPFVEDFVRTADILGDPKSKDLLRKLYDDYGIHPSEVMGDALTDVTIAQDLAAGKLPGYYVKNQPPSKALTIAEAQQAENGYVPPGEEPPKLVVARRMDDGSIVYGEPGDMHANLVRDGEQFVGNKEINDQMGFAVPGGPFMTRTEALDFVKKNEPSRANAKYEAYGLEGNDYFGGSEGAARAKTQAGEGGGKPPAPPPEEAGGGPSGGKGDLVKTEDTRMTYEEAKAEILKKVQSSEKPKEGLTFDQFYTRFVDDLNPVKVALKKEGIIGLLTSEDPYALFRLTRGNFGRADQMLLNHTYEFGTYAKNGRSFRDIMKEVGPDREDFKVYLIAKRAEELAARGIESGFGADIPKVAIEHLMDKSPKFERLQKELVGFQNRLSLYLRDSGLISQEGYKAMVEANRNYVPFFRFTDPQLFPFGSSGKGLAPKRPIKDIVGSDKDIIDPLEAIIKNTYAYIQLAEKNDASLKLIRHLQKVGKGEYAYYPQEQKALSGPKIAGELEHKVPPLEKGQDLLPKTEDTLTSWDKPPVWEQMKKAAEEAEATPLKEKFDVPAVAKEPFIDAEFEPVFDYYGIKNKELKELLASMARKPTNNEIWAYDKGVRVTLRVEDQELLNAWRNLDRQSANDLLKMLSIPARTLRGGVTLDPAFMARNMIWDFYSALINTKGALFNPVETFNAGREIARALRDGKETTDFQNWLKGGGANGTLHQLDQRYLQKNLERLAQETGFMDRAWNVVKSPLDGLRMVGELLENATRLAEFKRIAGVEKFGADPAASAAGKAAIQAAAMSSREVTMDYARIGAQMRGYNMITAFGNANIQGTDRLMRAMKESPFKTAAVMAGGITMPSVYLWWANHDDPRYKAMNDWEKDLFWVVMTKDTIFRIPKPGPAGVLFGTGAERALEAYFGDKPDQLAKFGKAMLLSLAPPLIPTFALPAAEQWGNKDSQTGGKLVPAYLESQLPEYQYTPYTTELSKFVGSMIGAFPGMRSAANDKESMFNGVATALTNPILIENYLRSWTGGMGDTIMRGTDALLRKAGALPDPVKPEDTLADIPFVKSFVVRYPAMSTQQISDFYELERQNESVMNTFRARMQEGDMAAAQLIADTYGIRTRLDKIKLVMGQQAAIIRRTYADPEATPADKRQLIDTLYMQRHQLATAGLEILKDERKRLDDAETIRNGPPRSREVQEQAVKASSRPANPRGADVFAPAPAAPAKPATGFGDIKLP